MDTVIIPTTWFDAGAGVHGELGRGFRYRAYVMAPLNAPGVLGRRRHSRTAARKASEANVRNAAFAGRAEYVGIAEPDARREPWSGKSSFQAFELDTSVRVGEADVRYKRDRLETAR